MTWHMTYKYDYDYDYDYDIYIYQFSNIAVAWKNMVYIFVMAQVLPKLQVFKITDNR